MIYLIPLKRPTKRFKNTIEKLRNLDLFYPTLLEQTAIAEILSDMDAEIAALEGKLSRRGRSSRA